MTANWPRIGYFSDISTIDIPKLLASQIVQNGAKLEEFKHFGNLSEREFSLDELALLAAPENLNLFWKW